MKCPNCPDVGLVMADRQGVEIDYCPTCRGIWLDRGELDKLLDRAAAVAVPIPPPLAPMPRAGRYPDHDDDDKHRRYHRGNKKSWLSEIFD